MLSLSGFDTGHAAARSAMPPCVPGTHARLAVERQGAVAVLIVHNSAVVGRVDRPRRTLRRVLEVLRTECCRVVQRRAVLAAQARRRFRPVHVALALRVVNDDEGQGH